MLVLLQLNSPLGPGYAGVTFNLSTIPVGGTVTPAQADADDLITTGVYVDVSDLTTAILLTPQTGDCDSIIINLPAFPTTTTTSTSTTSTTTTSTTSTSTTTTTTTTCPTCNPATLNIENDIVATITSISANGTVLPLSYPITTANVLASLTPGVYNISITVNTPTSSPNNIIRIYDTSPGICGYTWCRRLNAGTYTYTFNSINVRCTTFIRTEASLTNTCPTIPTTTSTTTSTTSTTTTTRRPTTTTSTTSTTTQAPSNICFTTAAELFGNFIQQTISPEPTLVNGKVWYKLIVDPFNPQVLYVYWDNTSTYLAGGTWIVGYSITGTETPPFPFTSSDIIAYKPTTSNFPTDCTSGCTTQQWTNTTNAPQGLFFTAVNKGNCPATTTTTTINPCPTAICGVTYEGFGFLYNWFAIFGTGAKTNGGRNPGGIVNINQPGLALSDSRNQWIVPSLNDYIQIATNLGGQPVAGAKMRTRCKTPFSTNKGVWDDNISQATNESNWTAVPGGWRDSSFGPGNFYGINTTGKWWTTTLFNSNTVEIVYIDRLNTQLYYNNNSSVENNASGCSIRLVRLATTSELSLANGTTSNQNSTLLHYVGKNGQKYITVKIGNQIWTTQNLVETLYNNGTSIPEVTGNGNWNVSVTTGARCRYSDGLGLANGQIQLCGVSNQTNLTTTTSTTTTIRPSTTTTTTTFNSCCSPQIVSATPISGGGSSYTVLVNINPLGAGCISCSSVQFRVDTTGTGNSWNPWSNAPVGGACYGQDFNIPFQIPVGSLIQVRTIASSGQVCPPSNTAVVGAPSFTTTTIPPAACAGGVNNCQPLITNYGPTSCNYPIPVAVVTSPPFGGGSSSCNTTIYWSTSGGGTNCKCVTGYLIEHSLSSTGPWTPGTFTPTPSGVGNAVVPICDLYSLYGQQGNVREVFYIRVTAYYPTGAPAVSPVYAVRPKIKWRNVSTVIRLVSYRPDHCLNWVNAQQVLPNNDVCSQSVLFGINPADFVAVGYC